MSTVCWYRTFNYNMEHDVSTWSEWRSGYFHSWVTDSDLDGQVYAAAIVEDMETGEIKVTAAISVRFRDPAETKADGQ